MEIKNIAIIGCGALGMMYGAHIANTMPDASVYFIADDARCAKYEKNRFTVNGNEVKFKFLPPRKPENCPAADLAIFTVKYGGLHAAVEIAKEYIGDSTIIMSFLNGITSEEIIGRTLNPKKIIHSVVAGMDATKKDTSLTYSTMGFIAFGGANDGVSNTDVERVAAFFTKAGLRYEIPADIMRSIWWKFMLNVGINQTSALLRAPYGLFQKSEHARKIMDDAMSEVYVLAAVCGVTLDKGDIKRCHDILATLSPDGKTSMCQDIEAGRHTEVELFSGAVTELAARHGVPVPVNSFLYNAIKALESGFSESF